mmetsp:Transcript_18701/g.44964  ORF Transcript_18701/g.44964 Transcript_18701/m.44964 type:complete len:318 (-) Transcript_18701:553-1506(-)
MVVGHALLWGTNVHLIVLHPSDRLLDTGQHPGTRAESSPFEEEGNHEKNVREWEVQECNGVGRGSQLPRDGGKDGGDNSSLESPVKEGLGAIGNSKDVLARTGLDSEGGEGSNQEEGADDSELTSDHESRKVLAVALEEKFAGLASEERSSAFAGRELGDSEECNLHTLKHTDNAHEDEEEDDRDAGRDGGVLDGHGSLSVQKGHEGHGQAESEDGERHEHAAPEEGKGESLLGGLVGDDGLSRRGRKNVLDQVRRVHDTRELDSEAGVECEDGEVVVHVVNHHVGGVHLSGELTKDAGEHNHGKTNVKEDKLDTIR